MTENKGLGRGLSALIGDKDSGAVAASKDEGSSLYQILPISQIDGNPNQPRTTFDEASLTELAESIKSAGLVQPVIVRRSGKRYELIAGERRWRAARQVGLDTIPAVIRDVDDAGSLEMALIENISREDLNPIDTARAYSSLQEDFGITQEQLAGKLGRSRSTVANTLRLLELPDEVQELIESGKLSEGHGRALLAVSDRPRLKQLALNISSRGLSVRQAEQIVKREAEKSNHPAEPQLIPIAQELMDEAADALYSALQMPVKVHWGAKGGRIEIQFAEESQLKHVLDIMEQN